MDEPPQRRGPRGVVLAGFALVVVAGCTMLVRSWIAADTVVLDGELRLRAAGTLVLGLLAGALAVASSTGARGHLVQFGLAVVCVLMIGSVGGIAAVGFAAVVGLVLISLTAPAAPLGRAFAARLVTSAYVIHLAVASALYQVSLLVGMGGAISTDDASYARVAWALAGYIRGDPQIPIVPPDWGGQSYLFGTWLYGVAAMFSIFGHEPIVPTIANAAIAVFTALAAGALAARMFGAQRGRIVAVLVAFYPSLLLWSSLNLKDPLVVALIVATFWCLLQRPGGPRTQHVLGAFLALVLVESLRSYVFIALAAVIPLAVALDGGMSRSRRWRTAAGTALASALLVITIGWPGVEQAMGDSNVFRALEATRQAMAVGARTAFVPVTPASSDPARASVGTQDGALERTVEHLPVGIAHGLFAPFPWSVQRLRDVLTVPEMLLWYSILVSVVIAWREALARWRSVLPVGLFIILMLGVMSVAEGNVGTIFRHRAMIIPLTILLASPVLDRLLHALIHRFNARHAASRRRRQAVG